MQDYVGHQKNAYPISNSVSYLHLKPHYSKCLATYSFETETKTFAEAAKDPKWVDAMQQDIQALEDNQTWSLVPLPPGKQPIGCKWVFKIKYHASGEIERFKARLVAKGYT